MDRRRVPPGISRKTKRAPELAVRTDAALSCAVAHRGEFYGLGTFITQERVRAGPRISWRTLRAALAARRNPTGSTRDSPHSSLCIEKQRRGASLCTSRLRTRADVGRPDYPVCQPTSAQVNEAPSGASNPPSLPPTPNPTARQPDIAVRSRGCSLVECDRVSGECDRRRQQDLNYY